MNLLLVSATFLEIEPLLTKLTFERQLNQKLRRYTYKQVTIDVLIPGVGMTATAYWMGKTLAAKLYDVALNVGLAGAFDTSIALGEMVNITADRISELGAEDGEKFLSLIDLDLIEDEDFHLVNGEMINTIPFEHELINPLIKVKAITVNTTHGEEKSILKIKNLYNPDVETMEGAAFYYACLLEGITCAQVRSISNVVEVRNKSNWELKLAVKNLNDFCWKLLQAIGNQ